MKISIITLFPKMIECFVGESIVKRAQEKELVEIEVVDLRSFAKDKYGTVDDRPYGGGVGMVLMIPPVAEAIKKVTSYKLQVTRKTRKKRRIVLTSPRGRVYTQSMAQAYAELDHLVIVSGHYEGVDERVLAYVDEEVSMGDFVLTGGEIVAASIVDSVVRLIPGVLKKDEAVAQESFFTVSITALIKVVGAHEVLQKLKNKGVVTVRLLEYPQYTRPEAFDGGVVPDILLSGNHAEIERWRLKQAFQETLKRRPDLLAQKRFL